MLDRLDAISATAEVRLINQIFLGNMLPQTVIAKAAQAHAKANPTRPPQKAQQPIPFSGTPLQGRNERLIPKAKPEPVPEGQPKAIHTRWAASDTCREVLRNQRTTSQCDKRSWTTAESNTETPEHQAAKQITVMESPTEA